MSGQISRKRGDPRLTYTEPIVTPTNTFNYSATRQATHRQEVKLEREGS